MRPVLCAALLGVTAATAHAADEAKPNTLTPKEIADGWLLLFDGETTFGWKIDGPAKLENGALLLGGEHRAVAELTTQLGATNVSYETKAPSEATWRTESGSAGAYSGKVIFTSAAGDPRLYRNIKGIPVSLAPFKPRFFLDKNAASPNIGNGLYTGKAKSLLLAYGLAGWRVHPGDKYKSQFTVNDGAELNIKNGPGDLQTEGQWDDFILQLECISHGDRLNSGVFFRCRPGEYQQGYEAQIHNGFADKPKEYLLDVFDPLTHELKGKKKESYHAIDFGTGAIYRRQPARKQVAKDHEWFAMTVVAQGRHFAVWVNGVQVTDWTDNRPLKDNARNGCRLEKGPISLQGHDPTTNLSFRNIRIAELPKK